MRQELLLHRLALALRAASRCTQPFIVALAGAAVLVAMVAAVASAAAR
ncbi:hypothetical protein ACFY3J_35105 [Streptomyces sp. NPDC001231]